MQDKERARFEEKVDRRGLGRRDGHDGVGRGERGGWRRVEEEEGRPEEGEGGGGGEVGWAVGVRLER